MVGNAEFLHNLKPWNAIDEVFQKAPRMDYVEARMLLQDAYDIHTGIFDHRRIRDHPFASVEMHDSENVSRYGGLSDLLHDYAEHAKDYWECWHLDVTQLLTMPMPYATRIREITRERRLVRERLEQANQIKVDAAMGNI